MTGVSLIEMLNRLPPERRAAVDAWIAELIAEEMAQREPLDNPNLKRLMARVPPWAGRKPT